MRKVIFLDVDGVLIPSEYVQQFFIEDFRGEYDVFHILSPVALLYLKKLVRETGADIVLSSCWRIVPKDVSLLNKWFAIFELPRVLNFTPTGIGMRRGDEINEWLRKNPDVTNFVIIDDSSDMGNLMNYLALCSGYSGLTKEIYEKALTIINSDNIERTGTK